MRIIVLFMLLSALCAVENQWFIKPLMTPAGERCISANLCRGAGDDLFLVWTELPDRASLQLGDKDSNLYFARWNGGAWSAAKSIAQGNDWFLNWVDLPSVCSLADGTLAAHWLRKSANSTYAYNIIVSLSHDSGDNWETPFKLHNDTTNSEHGFVSMRAASDHFFLVWLDGRKTVSEAKLDGHHHGDGKGAMTLRSARLNADGTVVNRQEIDTCVCSCCATDAVIVDDDNKLVVYRDREMNERRDISLLWQKENTWMPPRSVRMDNWIISGCPVNGPSLAHNKETLRCAWFTMADGQAAVYTAHAPLADPQFNLASRIDAGRAVGRVDVLMYPDGRSLVSWMESDDETLNIHIREINATGKPGASQIVARTQNSRNSGIPRIELVDGGVLLMWLHPGQKAPLKSELLHRRDE